MAKEIVKKEETPVVPAHLTESAWGAEGTDKRDILISKILLMQGLSKLVAAQKARMGEIVDSVSNKILGDSTKPIEFIPIMQYKTWVISERLPALKGRPENKFEFKRIEPMTASNSELPLEETTAEGITIRRDKCLNFYVMLPSEVAKDPSTLPYILSFSRTKFKEGRKLSTHFMKQEMIRRPPAEKVFNLSCTLQKNEKGEFYVFEFNEARKTSPEELQAAYDWYQILKQGQHKVDDSDLQADSDQSATTLNEGSQY